MGAKSACNLTNNIPKLIQVNLKSNKIIIQVKLKINKNQRKTFANCAFIPTNKDTAAKRQNREKLKSRIKKIINSLIVKLNGVSAPFSLRR